MSHALLSSVAVMAGFIAAITDVRSGRIPNWLTAITAIIGSLVHGLSQGAGGLAASCLGALLCGAVPGIVYKVSSGRGIGGGDIKLFAALGAVLGPTRGLEAELSSFVLLATFALFRLAFVGRLTATALGSTRILCSLAIPAWRTKTAKIDEPMTAMRMGPAIAVAVAIVIALPHIMRWLPWLG